MKTSSNLSILGCLVAFLISFSINAQDSTYIKTELSSPSGENTKISVAGNDYWSLGLHTFYSKPLNELDENCYRDGLAFDLEILSPSLLNKTSPLQLKVGAHLDYLGSGREKFAGFVRLDGDDKPADLVYRNNSFGFHGMLRLKLNNDWKVQPYIDGIIGGRALFSSLNSTLQDPDPEFESTSSDNIYRDVTFIFGGSVGALVKVSRMTSLDFRVTYSHGSRADFVILDEPYGQDPVDGAPTFTAALDSKTEMLFFSAGVKFDLDFSGFSSISSGNNNGNRRVNNGGVFYGGTRTSSTTRNRNSSSCEPRRRVKKSWNSGAKPKPKPTPKPKPKPLDY